MTPPDQHSDVPVVCTRSGLLLVLDAVLLDPGNREAVFARLHERGVQARLEGKSCSACSRGICEYRPLRGPLFVPRPT